MSATKTVQPSTRLIKGVLCNEKICWSTSTLAAKAGFSVGRIKKLIDSGATDQAIIDKAYRKRLKREQAINKFIFRPSTRVYIALHTLGVS